MAWYYNKLSRSSHKYIDKVTTKSGKIRYVYSGDKKDSNKVNDPVSSFFNVETSPMNIKNRKTEEKKETAQDVIVDAASKIIFDVSKDILKKKITGVSSNNIKR